MFSLYSDRLRVTISAPGEKPNDAYRFNRAGFISEVLLDGFMQFTASEPQNLVHPTTWGKGLCCEYTYNGYVETPDGEEYPKFGVGIFKKEAGKTVSFHNKPNCTERFDVECLISAHGDSAIFKTVPKKRQGYALEEKKKISLVDNLLKVENTLINVGDKAITMAEYCHNFISIDGMALSDQYHLEIPALCDQTSVIPENCPVEWKEHEFRITRPSLNAFFFKPILQGMDTEKPFTWTMLHTGAKARVTGTTSFVPSDMSIWGVDHLWCPEVFCPIEIKPGESFSWNRTWLFERDI